MRVATTFTMEQLRREARVKPPGYEEAILRLAKRNGDIVTLTREQWDELRVKYSRHIPPARKVIVHGVNLMPLTLPVTALPSVLTMAGNALGAVKRTAVAAVNGEAVYAPEGEFERRLAICKGQEATTETDGSASRPYQAACEFYLPEQGRCSECGCFVEKKVIGKCRLAREECPKGKWGKFEPQMVDTSPHPSPRERGEGEDNGRVQ